MNTDIRLNEHKFVYDGKEYILRCNFNVLAEVQEMCGGFLPDATDPTCTMKNGTIFLSAMMNDYADEQGWPERFTPKEVGRKINLLDGMLLSEVMKLVILANYMPSKGTQNSKN